MAADFVRGNVNLSQLGKPSDLLYPKSTRGMSDLAITVLSKITNPSFSDLVIWVES